MGKIIIIYALEKGYELLSAYDVNPLMIGQAVGILIGRVEIGVRVSNAKG